MEILWLAIVLYSIGLGVLLHFRPAYMFHENGTWKEFGYQRDSRYTLFPFWLFAITWAFLSYVLAATIVWSFFTPILAASTYVASMSRNHTSEEPSSIQYSSEFIPASNVMEEEEEADAEAEAQEEEEEDAYNEVKDVRIKRNRNIHYEAGNGIRSARPGYYVLDPSSKQTGIRQYIYYGPTPPTD